MTMLTDVKIESLGRIVTGKTPSKNIAEYFDGEFQFVTPSDLNFKHYYCRTTETTVSESAWEKHKNQFIPAGSIMFTCIGNTIGKCAIASQDCLTNQQINSVIPHRQNDSKFIYYFLNHYMDVFRGIGLSGGVATPIINKTDFSKVVLKAPDKAFWPEIGNLLSKYDDLIENNRRRIQLLEESARLLYQEWFIHLRFPGHEQVKIIDGVPEGWERSELEGYINFANGKAIKNSEEGIIPVYGANGIIGYENRSLFDSGVVIGRVGAYCGSTILALTKFWGSDNTIIAQPAGERFGLYFLYFMLTKLDLNRFAGGAAQPLLTQTNLKKLVSVFPSQQLCYEFDKFSKDIFSQINTLCEKNKKLAQARDLLLPKLMSGELTV